MESYTFRCANDECPEYGQHIGGVTMGHVVDAGTPICQNCSDDLELIGPDHGSQVWLARAHAKRASRKLNQPTAYSPVPGPPVNPRDVGTG